MPDHIGTAIAIYIIFSCHFPMSGTAVAQLQFQCDQACYFLMLFSMSELQSDDSSSDGGLGRTTAVPKGYWALELQSGNCGFGLQ